MDDWYRITLYRLIEICKTVASKYTRSKVRKALPKDFAYEIEELITKSRRCWTRKPTTIPLWTPLYLWAGRRCLLSP